MIERRASLAQLVEQQTLNLLVGGSIPSRRTKTWKGSSLALEGVNDMDRLGIGLVGAVALGAAAGIIVAPPSGRRIFAIRARRETERVAEYLREQSAVAVDALPDLVEAVEHAVVEIAAAIMQRFRTVNPTSKLEVAFASHTELSRRTIWVDAHGATLLLHGLVEDDEEWRSADQLARQISPDGTVRNLLQVRHKAQSE